MEDYAVHRLIAAVSNCPELWKVDSEDYCGRAKKDLAWKRVSESIQVSVELCRKRWRSLRDTYLKDRRKSLRTGSGTLTGSKWKYASALSFLDPLHLPSISPRLDNSTMGEVGTDMPSKFREAAAAAARLQGDMEAGSPQPGTLGAEDDLPGPAAASSTRLTAPALTPTGPSRKRTRKAHHPGLTERDLFTMLQTHEHSPGKMSEDEHFLYSLLPFLRNLQGRSKDTLKFKMFKLAFEAQEYNLELTE